MNSDTVIRSIWVVTEHLNGLRASTGDVHDPSEKRLLYRNKVSSPVGEVFAGTVPGRNDEKGITLYESVGFAVLDLAIAVEAYQQISGSVRTVELLG